MADRYSDEQIRQKSKDNHRFAGMTVTSAGLQGEESNPRTNGDGSTSGVADDVTLSDYGPDISRTESLVKNGDLPDGAESDVDEIAAGRRRYGEGSMSR